MSGARVNLGIAALCMCGLACSSGSNNQGSTGVAGRGVAGRFGGVAGAGGGNANRGTGGTAGTAPTMDAGADSGPSCAAPALGATWSEIAAPVLPAGFTVTDAWPAGADDFFFAGSDPSPSTVRRVLHWSQGCWAVELMVNGGQFSNPQIAGTAPDDVWFTAGDAIYHRDAGGWSPLDATLAAGIAPAPGNLLILRDVQARTPTDVWFASTGEMLHLLNGQWIKQQLSAGPPGQSGSITYGFNVISILGANDVWVGGGSDQIGNTMDPASMYHFDGQSWTIHTIGTFGVNALWPIGGSAFWITMPPPADQPDSIKRFDGNAVTAPPVAGLPSPYFTEFTSLWGRAAGDVWAAGEDVAHFDGSSWSRVADAPDAVRDTTGAHLDSVVTGDATATWLIGAGPRFFRKSAGAAP